MKATAQDAGAIECAWQGAPYLSIWSVAGYDSAVAEQINRAKLEAMFVAYVEQPTVEHVARLCGVHHATVRKYRVRESWDARLAEVRTRAQDEADHDLAKAMADSLRLVREYKRRLSVALLGKKVGPKEVTAGELERVIRLEAFVLGGVESRHGVITEFAGWTEAELEAFASDGTIPHRAGRGAA